MDILTGVHKQKHVNGKKEVGNPQIITMYPYSLQCTVGQYFTSWKARFKSFYLFMLSRHLICAVFASVFLTLHLPPRKRFHLCVVWIFPGICYRCTIRNSYSSGVLLMLSWRIYRQNRPVTKMFIRFWNDVYTSCRKDFNTIFNVSTNYYNGKNDN